MIGKRYLYKIYNKDGGYLTTWQDVSPPSFKYKINSGLSELNVRLARKFFSFGEGFDVKVGNELRLYVSDVETPTAIQIYSGELLQYHLIMAEKDEVAVTFIGYVTELAKRIVITSGGVTTINYSTEDPSHIIKDVIDKVGNKVTYTADSIDDTGISVSWALIQNTALEAIQRMTELAPNEWYWYVDRNNVLQFHKFSTDNILKLYIGKHINRLDLTKSGEELRNVYFFLGGGSPQLYKKYSKTSSISEYGQKDIREQDERITLEATATLRSNTFLNEYDSLRSIIVCTVIDSNIDPKNGVDIEILEPGQAVQIIHPNVALATTRWDISLWDVDAWDYNIKFAIGQPLRIQSISYFGGGAVLELGTTMTEVAGEINKNTVQLETFRGKDSPASPS